MRECEDGGEMSVTSARWTLSNGSRTPDRDFPWLRSAPLASHCLTVLDRHPKKRTFLNSLAHRWTMNVVDRMFSLKLLTVK